MGRASAAFQMIDDRKLFRQILPTCFFIVSVKVKAGIATHRRPALRVF